MGASPRAAGPPRLAVPVPRRPASARPEWWALGSPVLEAL